MMTARPPRAGLCGRRGRTQVLASLLCILWMCGCSSGEDHRARPESLRDDRRSHPRVEALRESLLEPGFDYRARVETERGEFVVLLEGDHAPYTVSNFIHLAESGFYDGLTFHSVIPGYVAQTGDPTGTGRGGPGYVFDDEIGPGRHVRGTVSMANQGRPHSNGSQFFLCLADLPVLDGSHTIFGRITEGMDVVDELTTGDRILGIRIEKNRRVE